MKLIFLYMTKTKELLIYNIKNLRRVKGWSQMKLAEEASLSTGMIGDIETGKKSPSIETLEKISVAFNVPTYCLMMDSEEAETMNRQTRNAEKIERIKELLNELDLS